MIKPNSETILQNGLRTLFIEQKELKDSGLGIAVASGPYFEEENLFGISHLLEHLISRLDAGGGDMRELIYQKGGVFDATTSVSQTYFFLYALNTDFLESSEVFIKGIFSPEFREAALSKSKESIVSEMANSQKLVSYEILRDMMWKDRRLKRSLMGERETLLPITLEDVSTYHKSRYLNSNVSVVVIGPKFPKKLEALLSSLPPVNNSSTNTISTETREPDFRIFEDGQLHSTLTFCFPTKGYRNLNEGRHLFRLAASVLNSMYIAEMIKSGFVYQSEWSWNIFPSSGEFVLEFPSLAPEHTLTVAKAAITLMDNWANLDISETEFDLIKKQRILAIRLVEGLSEGLPLILKDFSASEEAHTFEDAIGVYEKATLKETLETAKTVLLTQKPFLVVNMGQDSLKYTGELKVFLEQNFGSLR